MAARTLLGANAVVRILRPLPHHLAPLGVVGVGLGWSLGVAGVHWADVQASGVDLHQAVPLIVAGGMAMVLSLWLGVAAVLWAMCRVVGRRVRLGSALLLLSASGTALWIAAPAAAFLFGGGLVHIVSPLWVLVAVGLFVFCAQVATSLRSATDVSMLKASGCVALTGIFCASFFSLSQ